MATSTQKNILNTPAYIRYKQAHGWRYDSWKPGDLPPASICYRRMPGNGTIGLVQAYTNELSNQELERFTAEARKLPVRALKCFFVQPHRPDTIGQLERLGWRPAQHPKVPRSVIIKQLKPDEEAVFASFSKRARNEARKGAKEGTEVSEIEAVPANYPRMLRLIEATYSRVGINRSMREKTKAWDEYARDGTLRFFVARHDGEDLACATLVTEGDTAWYLDGGSVKYRNQLYATIVLQSEVIKAAARAGVKHYDFLGVSPKVTREAGQTHSMDGVTSFKQKFSDDFYDYVGVYELPVETGNYQHFRWWEKNFVRAYKRLSGKYWY